MKKEVKPISPFMEKYIKMAEDAMNKKGWNKATLTSESHASSAAVTRFFQDGMINSENVFKIFNTLGLICESEKQQSSEPIPVIHQEVREIFESKNEALIKSLIAHVQYLKSQAVLLNQQKEDIEEIKSLLQKGAGIKPDERPQTEHKTAPKNEVKKNSHSQTGGPDETDADLGGPETGTWGF